MCGIIGRWNQDKPIEREEFLRMRDTLMHRGPDAAGFWFSSDKMLALGHRRLSFLDLSDSGIQPMCNEDSSLWVTVNGEIYNYIELRNQLTELGHRFKSETDSEVLLHAWEEWGSAMLPKLNGMFAFGLWDEKRKKLILARDRFGIKPLYYYTANDSFIFASEIKAIIEDRSIKRELDYSSVFDYFYYRYVPSPKSIFKNIFKLEPGHFVEICNLHDIKIHSYYSPQTANLKIPFRDAVAKTENLLQNSVSVHIRSDVPIGSFLSGGYDSSVLVKYYSQFSTGFNTFTAGFANWEKSEDLFAKIVSDRYHTNFHKLLIDESDYHVLNNLMYYYDEPIADISIIPTFLTSKLASKFNKAVLSGEGADELFAGYTWHRPYLWDISRKQIRDAKKYGWEIPVNHFDVESYAKAMSMGLFGNSELMQLFQNEQGINTNRSQNWFFNENFSKTETAPKCFQLLDIRTFMGELVLTKIDRASMANSLEVRVPFLENNLFEFMINLSPEVYHDSKKQKIILRKLLKKDLPKTILNRKKQGFVGPDSFYMNTCFYRDTLLNGNCIKNNLFNRNYIKRLIDGNDYWRLWKLVVFELWYTRWMG